MKQINAEAIEMHNRGFSIKEISEIQGRKRSAVRAAIRRNMARNGHEIDDTISAKCVASIAHYHGVKIGNIAPEMSCLGKSMSRKIITKAHDAGYETVAEYLCYLAEREFSQNAKS